MIKAIDAAKFFMKQRDELDLYSTYDGNMKLQKLLTFANLISLAEYKEPLFDDDIYAFKNGCVVESVRNNFKYSYSTLLNDSKDFNPDFSERDYEVLYKTIGIFGNSTAKELSEINHNFDFWTKNYNNSKASTGYHYKSKSLVPQESMLEEIDAIKEILSAYKQNEEQCMETEQIHGTRFHYNPHEIKLDEDIISFLTEFSNVADESDYTIYIEEDELIIY